jgi:hypothetical protein
MESMRRLLPVLALGLGAALQLVGPGARAASVVLTPRQDNSMYSEDGTASNGAGQHLFSGRTSFGGRRRALLVFDVAGSVPAGATIESAALQLHVSLSPPGPMNSQPFSIHRLLSEWGEGGADAEGAEGTGAPAQPRDATWTDRIFPDTLWTTPGGDFEATASANQLVPQTSDGFVTWGSTAAMVADVQAWLDAPTSNFGWLVIGDEANPTTARRFDSRENLTAANHPTLTIEYAPPPAGVGAVPDGGDVPGTPLRQAKAGGAALDFSWGGSCSGGATDYAVYEGPLGSPFTAHGPLACSTGGASSVTLMPALAASSYFLVVPHDATVEGSYGTNSAEVERPQGSAFCVPQQLSNCP